MRVTLSELAWTLTALAGVVVLLTRIRLASSGQRPAGRLDVAPALLSVHTLAGVLALVLWVPGLITASKPLALLGVLAWWVVAVVGLLLLARWLPASGKHAGDAVGDEWTDGPWLSVLAHGGMLGGTLFFTWMVLAQGL